MQAAETRAEGGEAKDEACRRQDHPRYGANQLRGPGMEALRLIGYRSVRDVIAELARHSRRPSHIERERIVARGTFHGHAPELLRIGAITRRVVPGPPRQVFYGLGPSGPELGELIQGRRTLLRRMPISDDDRSRCWRVPIGFAEAWWPASCGRSSMSLAPSPRSN